MGDHDHGGVLVAGDGGQFGDYALRPAAIDGGGGFVGEDHAGAVDEGAQDRHPLALSAGELLGPAAEAVGASPWAFALTVALAASSAFSTPMATPTNTMVLTPGGYRFSDYLKAGFPLQVIVFLITMLLIPLIYGT